MPMLGTEVDDMLLNFSCNNFKSFKDGFVFNMIPEKRMTELDYSILCEKIADKEINALSASVIYGPNAAGKTSVVNAMSCLRQIVLRGNIEDAENDLYGDRISNSMMLIPFAYREDSAPVSFDITFVHDGIKFRYVLVAYLGAFLEKGVNRHVEQECLFVNDELIFDRRKESVEKLELSSVSDYLNVGYKINASSETRTAMSSNVTKDSLLIVTDFNSFCSKRLVAEFKEWFEKRFIVVNSANKARFFADTLDDEHPATLNLDMNRIASEAGIIGGGLAYVRDQKSNSTKLLSVFKQQENNELLALDADRIESVGTMRLVSIMPIIIAALKEGATLVMDELDASLHPMIIMNVISIFHNDDINKKGAQLIFNTHNPIYLNHRLLRRDEIKFVERETTTKSSSLYALSDFKANGEASVRKTSDYMKNYFINRYGAIVDIDFTDIIADVLKGAEDND